MMEIKPLSALLSDAVVAPQNTQGRHAERVATLSGAQAHAPAEVFKGLLGIARANLSAREWSTLAAALSVPERLAA